MSRANNSAIGFTRLATLMLAGLAVLLLPLSGCKKKGVAEEATDSDANGYLCPSCGNKFYTSRSEFPSTCPKCGKNGVEEVIGFLCEKDQHMTLVGRNTGKGGVACEKCGAPLSGMRLPREKDLKAWGAVKASP